MLESKWSEFLIFFFLNYSVNSFRDKLHVLRAQFTMFFVGYGKFGGKRTSDKAVPSMDPPSRVPDKVVQVPVSIDQVH